MGTSSLRRSAQLLATRPDLQIKWIRGNIDTRLAKLKEEEYDAIILAAAGLSRLGWSSDVVTQYLDPSLCLPAVGQGALSIECRLDDEELLAGLQKFECKQIKQTVTAERAFLHAMEGGCQVPIAGYATMKDDEVMLTALVANPEGTIILKEQVSGKDAVEVGKKAANNIQSRGGQELIDAVKEESEKE